jgi:hypothetical protein
MRAEALDARRIQGLLPDAEIVAMRLARRLLLAVLSLSSIAGTAFADGPYEPNETAAQAAPTGASVAGALETPQDVDWYRFYAKPQRQVGLLASLNGTCSSIGGTIIARVYDADADYAVAVMSVTLGYEPAPPHSPKTADQATFTSEAGHRYFIQVRQSLCQGVGYTLQLAPTNDLADTLQDTVPCLAAKGAATAARRKLYALRAATKRAHGSRRRSLRSRTALQRQQVVVATATQTSTCTRRALDQYPFV